MLLWILAVVGGSSGLKVQWLHLGNLLFWSRRCLVTDPWRPGQLSSTPLAGGPWPSNYIYFCATFAWLLSQFCHLEIYTLSTPWQMPQTITNIPRYLSQILTLPKFWYHLAHSFLRENEAQEMTPKLWQCQNLRKATGNICDRLWHLSRRGYKTYFQEAKLA